MNGKALYKLYRSKPPINADGSPHTGGLHRCAYWDGFFGSRRKYVRGSVSWWANKAGRDNANQNELSNKAR